jgi:RNA polymerase sigma factor (sigma-70 family)
MAGFDLEKFRAWQTETDPKKKARLLSELVKENIGLIRKFAARCARKMGTPMEMEDVLQAATIGMLTTLDKYNPERAKFSTYAFAWVNYEIQRVAGCVDTIKRPRGAGMPHPVFKVWEEIRLKHGRDATPEELSKNPKGIAVTQADLDEWDLAPVVFPLDVSLEVATGEAHVSPGYNIPDEGPRPDDSLDMEDAAERLRTHLSLLTDKEQEIIEGLFFEERSYAEMAKRQGVSEETLRERRNKALAKLKEAIEADEDE